jgi:membrane dipeptidase
MGANDILRASIVWDNHTCLPVRPEDASFLPQLERARASGFSVVSINIGYADTPVEQHFLMLAQLRHWVRTHPEHYMLVLTAADAARARHEDKLGVCFDLEGAGALPRQPGLVRLYYDLGVRWMLLAYNRNNAYAGGCLDDDGGLTAQGVELVEEMATVGMVTCASHAGPRTARAIIDTSPNPVIFSHSNARALHDHPRNITDDIIRACAARGGVIGINGLGPFLGTRDELADAVARHIDHVAQLVGIDHVALGLDYAYDQQEVDDYQQEMRAAYPNDRGYAEPFRMLPPEGLTDVVTALIGRGYGEADLKAVLGANLQRIARHVWK